MNEPMTIPLANGGIITNPYWRLPQIECGPFFPRHLSDWNSPEDSAYDDFPTRP